MAHSLMNLIQPNESLLLYAIAFQTRPLGFKVAASNDNKHAIVTNITEETHRENGLRIGSIISEINDKYVESMGARQVIKLLNGTSVLPIKVLFKQQLFDISFYSKQPIGFISDGDINGNDCIVTNVYNDILSKNGLKIGCYVYKIGSLICDGLKYQKILNVISQQNNVPFTITFRRFDIDLSSTEDHADEYKLQSLCGGTMKNFLSLDTLFASWKRTILKTNKETMQNQSLSTQKLSISDSPCIERIVFILCYYQRWIEDHKNKKNKNVVYSISMNEFFDRLQNYDIVQMLNDYNHILNVYSDTYSLRKLCTYLSYQLGIIESNKDCLIYLRNNRNRKMLEFESYFVDYFDQNEIVIQQICDKIYCFLMCSSFYHRHNEIYLNKPSDDEFDSKEHDFMMDRLKKHKAEMNEIRGNDRMKYNKYLTKIEVFDHESKEESNDDDITGKERLVFKLNHGHQFGVRYHYWNYYKSFDEATNYFVKAKHVNFKEEILDKSISFNTWRIVHSKAKYLQPTIHCKSRIKARKGFVRDYGIKPDDVIDIDHLMALLFYCNCHSLCIALKDSYIKSHKNESYQQLKENHSNYAHFARLLIECVQVFGDEMSKKEQYTHCIDNEVLFGIFSAEFHSPTSVTSKLSVSHTFCGDDENGNGLMLVLGSDYFARYFDMAWISDDGIESEKLIIGGQYMEIRSIINIKTKENYQFYMDAIKIFQTLMDGEYILQKISNSIISILIDLINNELLKEHKELYDIIRDHKIPIFVDRLFNNYCKRIVNEVTIRMCYLSKKYISSSLRKYFVGKNEHMLKLDILFNLFPSMDKLRVTFEQNEGIVLDESSYEYFLHFLKAQSEKESFCLNELLIRPNDRKSARIEPMIEKYANEFKKYGIGIKKETNVFGDDYVCFEKVEESAHGYEYCTIL